ncbi:IclR family transcriptional regulator [Rhodobacteraceae bacterium N5(2021)]|uniref:IclR family transcriptional regulator n=1 Tax=Gymnodinialimonas phycosphaerae TaxID=2841589 RepID=A0A975YGR3_9RHOB|nr:IclR family transcriptional regulator [Gymnodinialimonas phycosphaerae]MBY4891824.1 IclR family transcriptional regulator [Gymnodinialimonas phycosphaerae]
MSAGSGERLLSILDLFTEDHLEWTPQDMMEVLGFSRPTLYRYLKVLKETGFLAPVHGAAYGLGPRFVEMDFLARQSDPLVTFGQDHLKYLSAQFPGTAFLVRWYGERSLCVASVSRDAMARTSYPRGRPMPLLGGAASKAILAFLPRRQRKILAQRPDANRIATSEAEVQEVFRTIRQDGFVVAHGEVTPGIVGSAAPVFDAGENPIASLCVSMEEADYSGIDHAALHSALRAATKSISAAMADTQQPLAQKSVGEFT